MTGTFLDTTVVIHIAEGIKPNNSKGEAFIAVNQPSEMPYYALRELQAGRMRVLCDAHNKLHGSTDPGEALLGLLSISPAEGRKREGKLLALAESLKQVFQRNPDGSRSDMKREMLQAITMKVQRLWTKAQKIQGVKKVQSLACFNEGKLTYGLSGELRGPNNSFNCVQSERCAAAGYIYDNNSDLAKMIDSLHPSRLDEKAAHKNENAQRRKALKELQLKGPEKFNKNMCRALGDAYFAAMCPAGSVVLTSNVEDHAPLCKALGKNAMEPN